MAKRQKHSHRKPIGKRIADSFNALTEAIEKGSKNAFEAIGKVATFLGSILIPRTLTKRFEKATSATGQSVGKRVGAITENVEKKFSKGASGILSSLAALVKPFIPKTLIDWCAAKSKAINQWLAARMSKLGKQLGSLAERYLPKWLVNATKRFSAAMSANWRTTSKFNTAWWKSRDFAALAWATPAFLLAIPVSVLLAAASIQSPNAKIGHYSSAMFTALEAKEFAKADLYQKKLSQLGYRKMENVEFNAALALAEDGDMQSAYEKMLNIASLDTDSRPEQPTDPVDGDDNELESETENFPPAHIWIAGAFLKNEIQPSDPSQRLVLAKRHAEAALELDSRNFGRPAKYMIARFYLATNQRSQALEFMEELVTEYPDLSGELRYYLYRIRRAGSSSKCCQSIRSPLPGFEPGGPDGRTMLPLDQSPRTHKRLRGSCQHLKASWPSVFGS